MRRDFIRNIWEIISSRAYSSKYGTRLDTERNVVTEIPLSREFRLGVCQGGD